MPFARIDLAKGKTSEYRATLADVVYQGIVDVLKAPDGDRFVVIGEHSPDNLIYDPHFLGWDRSPDFILIQVTSTVGNNKESKLAFFRYIADELKRKLSVRPDDAMINMVFVDRSDWSFGNGEPWTYRFVARHGSTESRPRPSQPDIGGVTPLPMATRAVWSPGF